MLDTGLTWELAKEQCGEGVEFKKIIDVRDDAYLFDALWREYRKYYQDFLHLETDLLIPFINGIEIDCNSYIPSAEVKRKGWQLYDALQSQFMKYLPISPIDSSYEILLNAIDIQRKHEQPTILHHYHGKRGNAFSAENIRTEISHEAVLQKRKNGNQGKGWPLLITLWDERTGIEQCKENHTRVIAIKTIEDMDRVLTKHAKPAYPEEQCLNRKGYIINSQPIWEAKIKKDRLSMSLKKPTKSCCTPLPSSQSTFWCKNEEIISEFRTFAWQKIEALQVKNS